MNKNTKLKTIVIVSMLLSFAHAATPPPLPKLPVGYKDSKYRKTASSKAKLAAVAPDGSFLNVATFGYASPINFTDHGRGVTVDGNGNVLAVGYISSKPFVVKRSPEGAETWLRIAGSSGSGTADCVATDAAGNVIVGGHMAGPGLDFGCGFLTAGGNRTFLVKYNADGVCQWAKSFGGSVAAPDFPESINGVAIASDGSIVIVGHFEDSISFGGPTFDANGQRLPFIAKLTASGDHVWSHGIIGANSSAGGRANSVAIDANGTIFMGGYLYGRMDFGGSVIDVPGVRSFYAKYESGGNNIWCHVPIEGYQESVESLALDKAGGLFVTGYFASLMRFGPPGTQLTNGGFEDVFFAKLSASDGSYIWSKRFGLGGSDYGYGVATDGDGNVFLAGKGSFNRDFGGGVIPLASGVAFLAKFGPDGTHRWSKMVGNGTESAHGVAIDPYGHAYMIGDFAGTVNFGGGPVTSTGSWDVFLSNYAIDPTATVTNPPPGRLFEIMPFGDGYYMVISRQPFTPNGMILTSSESVTGPWGPPSNYYPYIALNEYLGVQLPSNRPHMFVKAEYPPYSPSARSLAPLIAEVDTKKTIDVPVRDANGKVVRYQHLRVFASTKSKNAFHLKP